MSSNQESPSRVAIGITFGNSYSSVAGTFGGDAKVIANEEGDRQIPTVLSYVEGEEFVGAQAKQQLIRNPKNTVAGFRDFLGKEFKSIDPTPSHSSAHPEEHNGTVAFTIKDTGSQSPNTVSISEIAQRYFNRLKRSASDYLGKEVNATVIAVPSDFTDAQKNALIEVAKKTGIEVLQLINEPIAAALAHDRRNDGKAVDKTVVVADLGGSRSDVAVVSVRGGMYSILATSHDYSLGGAKLDEVLMEHCAKEFMKKHKTDPRQNERSLAKLRLEAEATKKALSLGSTAAFNVESLADGIDFSLTVNRTRYDILASKVFARFTQLVEDVVKKAQLDPLDIDEILLSGGTAHTPKIASNISNAFPESTTVIAPSTDPGAVNPSELAARGAALQAFLIEGFEAEDIEQSTHPAVTVTPHLAQTIGLVLGSNDFKPVIPAETPLPVRRTIQFTSSSASDAALIRVCEGTREIKVTKPEPKAKTDGKSGGADEDDDDDDEDFDDEEDEEEDVREKVWKAGSVVGELAIRDLKKGAKVNVQISILANLEMTISASQPGKTGARGIVPGSAQSNGAAH